MGKNQTIIKDTESQGVCAKIFKALNLSQVFRCCSRNPKSATKPRIATTDHQRNDPAKATKFKLAAQNGSTNFPLHELKGQKTIPLHENDQNLSFASNRILVEYNHSSVDTEIPKSVDKSPVEMFAARDHLQTQDYDESTSKDRFSKYIDHVKSKMNMSSFDEDDSSGVGRAATRRETSFDEDDSSGVGRAATRRETSFDEDDSSGVGRAATRRETSFDEDDSSGVGRAATRRDSFDDKIPQYIDQSKFKIRTVTIACGD